MSMYKPVNRAVFKNASVMMEGDTKNEIIVRLLDKDDAPVDLTGRTVTWTAANERGKIIDNRPAAVYLAGEVGIKFLDSDSFGDGVVFLQFAVTWATGQIERFPASGDLFMKVSQSHDNVRYTPVSYVTIEEIDADLQAKFDAYAETVQQGAKGDPGAGLVIVGTLTSTSQLPTSSVDGTAYLINGDLHVRANGNWTNAGRIQGPKGDPGERGPAGATGSPGINGSDGKGLEFTWNGYTLGTRREGDTTYIYSQSLRGATGAQGIQGIQGNPGATGERGPAGTDGKSLEYSWNGYTLGVRRQGETAYTYSGSLRGPTGATGSQGIQGVQGNPGPKGDTGNTGNPGPKGDQGIPGEKGEKGDTGAGLNIKGSFTSTDSLPASGVPGDAYLVNGALYVWNGSTFTNVGSIQGPAGEAGPIGETGPAGKNLEFLWNGYTLGVRQQGNTTYTYSQSLRGVQGAQGIQGVQGNPGIKGDTGNTGAAGKNLEFLWNGTQLGVRQEGAASYTYVDLKGAKGDTGNTGLTGQTGQTGAAGKNLEFLWSGTQLGVRQEGQTTYTYVNLQGPQGIQGIKGDTGSPGEKGDTGSQGIQGIQGIQGVAGKNLEFVWSGTTLGVRQQGAATYTYSASLQGPQGIQGIQGIKGDKGDTGSPGANASLIIEQRTSDPASPVNGQVWLRTDLV